MKDKSYVVISEAPKINYLKDYVSLPKNYGSKEYFERQDVRAIMGTVYKNLDELNSKTNFFEKIREKKIFIKPNLVSVYHKMGFKDDDYPESTDPRVFDAIISYFKKYTKNIVIIESSGKGMPTMVSFKVSGLDRVAKYHRIKYVALENEAVIRYMLPKAEVMREVYIPKIMKEVIEGRAIYVSVPKMKTNLYTGVTLGFKNAMGIIPYNLRQRNHNYNINKKLVDLLYLFKPDLTIIDGIIGGEGCTPAPVDPVEMGVIVSGDNSVETDRIATRMMGINSEENKLIREATKRGFNDDEVVVSGNKKVVQFRKAEASMMNAEFKKNFPNVKVLVGHMKNNAPVIKDINNVTPEIVRIMEKACDGGCLAATKTSFEIMRYVKDFDKSFSLVVILGAGVKVEAGTYYFDSTGKPYSIEDIKNIKQKRLTIGECTRKLKPFCEYNGKGCCSPSSCMLMPFKAADKKFPLLSTKNKYALELAIESLRTYLIKRKHVKQGEWVDCSEEAKDKIFDIPELDDEEKILDYIEWPLPELTNKLKKKKLKEIHLML